MNATRNTTKSCSVEGCDRAYLARGYCTTHWRELWRDVATDDQLRYQFRSLQDAFDKWPTVTDSNGCILWGGNRSGYEPNQYGVLTFKNKHMRAHRAAYELRHGEVPDGFDVDHICHTKLCVNPDHLRITTRKQNQENRNRANQNSRTGHRGITFDKSRARGRYRARIKHNYKEIHVGRFDTLEDAVSAVAEKRRELFTHSDLDH